MKSAMRTQASSGVCFAARSASHRPNIVCVSAPCTERCSPPDLGRALRGRRSSPDKIPENIDFAARELLEPPAYQRSAKLENIAKALTRRLLQDQPGIGAREVSERAFVKAI